MRKIDFFLKGKNGLRDYRDERAITW